jgi:hypothetical protein
MLCVQLQSRFDFFNTPTGPTRSVGRGPLPLANEWDWSSHSCCVVFILVLLLLLLLVLVLNSSSRFARRIHDTELLFSRALFLNQYHAANKFPLSTEALSDRSNQLDTSTLTVPNTRRRSSMNVNRPNESVNQIWQAIETRDESRSADTVLYKDTVVKDKDKAKDLGSSRTAYFEYSSRCRYRE